MQSFGVPEDYARVLAELDTNIKKGKEEISNDTVLKVTGIAPKTFADFVEECVRNGVWVK